MDTQDKSRQQLADILGINISPARCATHLKKNLLNEEVENKIKELRDKIKVSKNTPGSNADEAVAMQKEINKLAQNTIRISSETSAVVAVICNGFVENLLKHGITHAIANNTTNSKNKNVSVSNIMSGDHKGDIYYSVYSRLPSYVNYDQKNYVKQSVKSDATKKSKKAKEEAKEQDDAKEQEEKEAENKSDNEPTNGEPDGVNNKLTFITYIDGILKNLKTDSQYSNIHISSAVKKYLSNMVIEAIERFVALSKIIVEQIMKVRTMNSNHIKAIINIFMKDDNNSDEVINSVINLIDDKLKLYHDHMRNNKLNKPPVVQTEEEQKVAQEKKQEAEKVKKQKALQLAEKRAAEAAARLKQLTEEIAK